MTSQATTISTEMERRRLEERSRRTSCRCSGIEESGMSSKGFGHRQDVCAPAKPDRRPVFRQAARRGEAGDRQDGLAMGAAPSANAASESSSSGLSSSRGSASRSWTSALPTSSTARSSVRARARRCPVTRRAGRTSVLPTRMVGGNEATAERADRRGRRRGAGASAASAKPKAKG